MLNLSQFHGKTGDEGIELENMHEEAWVIQAITRARASISDVTRIYKLSHQVVP